MFGLWSLVINSCLSLVRIYFQLQVGLDWVCFWRFSLSRSLMKVSINSSHTFEESYPRDQIVVSGKFREVGLLPFLVKNSPLSFYLF